MPRDRAPTADVSGARAHRGARGPSREARRGRGGDGRAPVEQRDAVRLRIVDELEWTGALLTAYDGGFPRERIAVTVTLAVSLARSQERALTTLLLAMAHRQPSVAALTRSRSEPEAFADVYETYARDVLRFFARRTLDPEAALDLTAESFAQAYAGRRSFRGRTSAEERSWVFTIARRQLAAYYERGSVERRGRDRLGIERVPAQPEELARVEELAGSNAMRQTVAAELSRLPEAQRQAVTLRVVEELGYPEVAERMDVSEQTARARVSRGLRSLRTTLASAGEEPR